MQWRSPLVAATLGVAFLLAPIAGWAACQLSATGLAYGDYVSFDKAHLDSRATIKVSCTDMPGSVVSYSLKLSAGLAGAFHPRKMLSESGRLSYELFRNPARSEVWGDGTGNTKTVVAEFVIPASGGPVEREHRIYGRLFAGQSVPPGVYSDVVQATLEACDSVGQCEVAMIALEVL